MSNTTFNVQSAPYNAAGDGRRVLDGTCLATSTTVTAPASKKFQAGDVGKLIWCTRSDGVSLLPLTTIATFVNDHTVTTVLPATGNGTGCLVWGTDDTAAFLAAEAAAIAAFDGWNAPTIYAPGSGYIVSARIYNNVISGTNPLYAARGAALIGDGKTQTTLLLAPNFSIPGDGTGALFANTGHGGVLRDLSINGNYILFPMVADQDFVRFIQADGLTFENVDVVDMGTSNPVACSAVALRGCFDVRWASCLVQKTQGSATGDSMGGIVMDTVSGDLLNVFSSNWGGSNVVISNTDGRSPASKPLNWQGGGWDEGTSPTCQLIAAKINLRGVTGFGGNNPTGVALDVDRQSEVFAEDSNFGRFQAETGVAVNVPLVNRGLVVSKGTTWRGNDPGVSAGPAKFMQNLGTFVDVGANQFRRYTDDTTFTSHTPAEVFDLSGGGKMPIVNGSWFPFAQVPR